MKNYHIAVSVVVGIEDEVEYVSKAKAFSIMSSAILAIGAALGRLDAGMQIITAFLILGTFWYIYHFPPKGGWSSTFFRSLRLPNCT